MCKPEIHDAVIIGGGAHGAASFYQLAKRGVDVICVDQGHPPHNNGSSHGDTRITRQGIGEGLQYSPLAMRSNEIWRELESQTGRSLMVANGMLIIAHRDDEFLRTTIQAAEIHGVEKQILSVKDIQQLYPQFIVDDDEKGYFEPGSGFLRPEECIATQLELGKKFGGQLMVNTRVDSIRHSSDYVEITTDREELRAKKVIITAGAWIKKFLPEEFHKNFVISRQTQFWFQTNNYQNFQQVNFPTFISIKKDGRFLYGFPAIDGPNGGLKVASHNTADITDPDNVNRVVSSNEVSEIYRDYVKPRLIGLSPNCNRTITCMYTSTPDSDFVIDWHPEDDRILFGACCSGHSFKHSATVGEIMAQLIMGQQPAIDISSFSLKRFAS